MFRTSALLALVGCGSSLTVQDEGDGTLDGTGDTSLVGDDDDDDDQGNRAPTADAGDDQEARVTDEVRLDGGASSDPDNDALRFEWSLVEFPSGSSVELLNADLSDASFYADRAGLYVLELAVDDGVAVDTDEVEIAVSAPNEGPVANAGVDQTVDVGDRVLLNGSASYDPDADALSHVWDFVSKPAGSGAALTDTDSAFPQFTADTAGTYVIQLTVTDGATVSEPDQVRVVAAAPGSSDCLSCETAATQLDRRMSAGQAASGGLLALLPLVTMAWQRRRARD